MLLMGLTEGLYGYEVLLLFLGALLFIVAIVLLVVFALQKRSLKSLSVFFVLSLAMMGYPGWQSFEISGLFSATKASAEKLKADPENSEARAELQEAVDELTSRPLSGPEALFAVAQAQEALGDTLAALQYADSAAVTHPEFGPSRDLVRRLKTPRIAIESELKKLDGSSPAMTDRNVLTSATQRLLASDTKTAFDHFTIGRAYVALGDTTRSQLYLDSALTMNPNLQVARDFRRSLLIQIDY